MKTFENIVEERIGFGRYQIIVLVLLALIFISDGMEMSALSLIFPILNREWGMSESLQGALGSVMFLGFFLGSLASGILTDRFGRKTTLEYVSLAQFVVGIISSSITSPYAFLVIRGIFGFLLGYQVPLIPTLCAELVPIEKRGKATVIINTMFSVGQLFATLLAYVCLSSLVEGNWRMMLFISSFPSLLVWYGAYKYLSESPRQIMLTQSIEKGVEILNKMGTFNKGDNFKEFTSKEDYKDFATWRDYVNSQHKGSDDTVKDKLYALFNKQNGNCRISSSMWLIWFAINFTWYGIVFILPFFFSQIDLILQRDHKRSEGIGHLIITAIGEGASGILAYFLVDTETFGRKNSLALGQLISGLACLIAYFVSYEYDFLLLSLFTSARFFAKLCFAVIYPLSAEIYSTRLRTVGIGFASAIGRVANIIMPFVCIQLFYIDMYLPFLVFFFFALLGLVGTYCLPYDTRGKHLDTFDEQSHGDSLLMRLKKINL